MRGDEDCAQERLIVFYLMKQRRMARWFIQTTQESEIICGFNLKLKGESHFDEQKKSPIIKEPLRKII